MNRRDKWNENESGISFLTLGNHELRNTTKEWIKNIAIIKKKDKNYENRKSNDFSYTLDFFLEKSLIFFYNIKGCLDDPTVG